MIEDLENEIWRDIDGYVGLYKVSNFGRVKSIERHDKLGRCIKEKLLVYDMSSEYYAVNLSNNGKRLYHERRFPMGIPNQFFLPVFLIMSRRSSRSSSAAAGLGAGLGIGRRTCSG